MSARYRCTTCGCAELPPIFKKTIAEFEALSIRERDGVLHILVGYRLYGDHILDSGWSSEVAGCITVFLPSFLEAREIGSIEDLLTAANDPEEAADLPPEWDFTHKEK